MVLVAAMLLTAASAQDKAKSAQENAKAAQEKGKAAQEKGKAAGDKAKEDVEKGKAAVEKGKEEVEKSKPSQDKKMASPPAIAEGTIEGVKVMVNYHQPSARGRKVMGGLVPYKQVWRTGANATPSIVFGGKAKVEGNAIAPGKYGLYTIPGEDEWTIIFNKDIKWGSDEYTDKNDVLRVKVKPAKTDSMVETFTISVEKNQVILRWENTQVAFTVSKG